MTTSGNAPTRELLPIASAGDTARATARLLGRHRSALALAVLAFLVAGLSAMVAPWVLGMIVDAVRAQGDRAEIVVLAGAIGVAALVGAVASALAQAFLARAAEPALAELREGVLARALELDSGRLERAGAGDLLSRVGDDVRTIARSLNEVVPLVVESALAVALTTAGLFALDWRLGLAGLAAVPSYVLGLRWYLPRSAPLYREERIAQGERAQAVIGGLQGATTLRAYGRGGSQTEEIRLRSMSAKGIALRVFVLLTRFGARNNRSELVGLAAILLVGFYLVRADAVTVGAVTAAALYFHRLFNPIGALLMLFDEVQSTGASLARLVGVTEMPRPAEGASAPPPRGGDLVATGLAHEYVEGHRVLHDVSLTLRAGERVAVVGATGAGKTTLGAVLAGVLRPTQGGVTLGDTPFGELDEHQIRERVVLVSQDVHVFSGSVGDAVTLARGDADDDAVRHALTTARAWEWVAALPEGIDTLVGEDGRALTSAQAQQLALARVALRDPDVVVLDEATAEAGSAGARVLEEAALAVTEGRTALIVAHRLTQSAAADRVLVMSEGRIVEDGTHDQLLASGGEYAELWAAWSRR